MASTRVFWTTLALAACADLRPLANDQRCGNLVLEPGAGEDCDTFTLGENTECGRPDTAGACRLVCPPITSADCPPDWVCGGDGVCRQPSGTFSAAPIETALADPRPDPRLAPQEDPLPPQLGDFDGDAIADLVTFPQRSRVAVAYGERGGRFTAGPSIDTGYLHHALVEDLDRDGKSDLALGLIHSIQVFRGASARELIPVLEPVVATRDLDRPELMLFTLRSAGENGAHDLLLLEARFDTATELVHAFLSQPLQPEVPAVELELEPDSSGDERLELGAIENIDAAPGGAEEEFAITRIAGSKIHIYSARCTGQRRCAPELRAVVVLPAPLLETACAVQFADFDGDGRADVIAEVAEADFPLGTAVAFGDGRGQFCSVALGGAADCAGAGGQTNQGSLQARFEKIRAEARDAVVCAAGDFDGDGIADYVSSTGEIFITAGEELERRALAEGIPAQGDFNGDGITDLVAAGRQFLGTSRGIFNSSIIESAPTVSCAATGDFDGDFFDDCAFGPGELGVLFGGAGGLRGAPVRMGTLLGNALISMRAGHLVDGSGALLTSPASQFPDLIEDLVAVTSSGATLLAGSAERRMTARAIDVQNPPFENLILYAGRFSGDDEIPDLVAVRYQKPFEPDFAGPQIRVLTGLGRGHFLPRQFPESEVRCEAVTRWLDDCGDRVILPSGDADRIAGVWHSPCGGLIGELSFSPSTECRTIAAQFNFAGELLRAELGLVITRLEMGHALGVYFGEQPAFEGPPESFPSPNAADWTLFGKNQLAGVISAGSESINPKLVFARLSREGLEVGAEHLLENLPWDLRFVDANLPNGGIADADGDGFEDLVLFSSTRAFVFSQRPLRE